jgi:hypothetical protein
MMLELLLCILNRVLQFLHFRNLIDSDGDDKKINAIVFFVTNYSNKLSRRRREGKGRRRRRRRKRRRSFQKE